ncbi:hypothetical protein CEUSTIGMA_g9290.t1 [Chlamydomonas eustigma]|uniref:RSE1/DDB1/CPSF1 C-terminal domain-containing protein n=1 Tax=Chlamydomonas eustigma TaxID=1157962 RepID=A0A250XG18_9CHLO|nr:hypothetical protein CEUSTIGMA_g9290.t1 [Chlamydomonas eustigma]|eukprot:GAX81862.1 hypothetical protein CEUSTIGMA_g9290.t1 [Chlamydomonas eustigma]
MDVDEVLGSLPTAVPAGDDKASGSGMDSRSFKAGSLDDAALKGLTAHHAVAFRRWDHLESLPPYFQTQAYKDVTSTTLTRHLPRMTRFEAVTFADPVTGDAGPRQAGVVVTTGACGRSSTDSSSSSRSVLSTLWLVAGRGTLRPHPMSCEGPVTAMTPFHNPGCQLGFILACPVSGTIKVCQLPPKARLDMPWIATRFPLKATPHRIALFKEASLLTVAVSRSGRPYRQRVPEEAGGDPHASAVYAAADASAQKTGREESTHEVCLLTLPSCQPAPLSRPLLLMPGESILALRTVYLKESSTTDVLPVLPLLAVGTSSPLGEDYPCLGRILLYWIAKVPKESVSVMVQTAVSSSNMAQRHHRGSGGTVWCARLMAQRELPGPISCVRDFKGFLLLAVGSRVELWSWSSSAQQAALLAASGKQVESTALMEQGGGGALTKVAFYDAPMLVVSVNIVKDYILLGDVHQVTGDAGPRQAGVVVTTGACGRSSTDSSSSSRSVLTTLWLVAGRGTLRPHPMSCEGPVTAMTPFHNPGCQLGFILACPVSGTIKVCQLPPKARLDMPWIATRFPLKATPHRLALFKEASLLTVAVSRSGRPYRQRVPEEAGGDPHASAVYAAADASAQKTGREESTHEVCLLTLPSCQPAPLSRPLLLMPGESILALRTVYLKESSTTDVVPVLPLLAVGTSSPLGEDYPCLGRILLYWIAKVPKESVSVMVQTAVSSSNMAQRHHRGSGGTVWCARLMAQRELPGPISCVRDFKGFLLLAVGSRVELWSWSSSAQQAALLAASGKQVESTALMEQGGGGALTKVAFYDAPMLVVSVNIVKDYILLGDVHQGVQFLRYLETEKVLKLLGRDFDDHDVTASGIIINASKLLFMSADSSGTLHQCEFNKNHPNSWSGTRLVPGAALHTGQLVTRMLKAQMKSSDNGVNRNALYVASASGSLGVILPVWDSKIAARLSDLQRPLTLALRHTAGLNPRAFRRRHLKISRSQGGSYLFGRPLVDREDVALLAAQKSSSVGIQIGTRQPILTPPTTNSMLDGDLLKRFATNMSRPEQLKLVKGVCRSVTAGEAAEHAETLLADITQVMGAVQL